MLGTTNIDHRSNERVWIGPNVLPVVQDIYHQLNLDSLNQSFAS